ncbi:MAG: polysulfide reductase NrfD [Deltaproteobacteria bacterium]|nr:polysulfide reductase NrfD [Deltaproteobacteria bacterium]
MDSALIPKGVKRCPLWQFILFVGAVGTVVLWGVYAMLLCWFKGLNQTNMNDAYGFALWIWADLAVIAVGGGAFFSGLLLYIFGKDVLKSIINYAVLIGFICYSSALLILAIDIGQPLRGWFIFWHANVHSMLTEVAFCLSAYFCVLTIEYIPLILENRQIDKVPFFHKLGHNMHEIMAVFAATGAFLSFFHQGSLGGVSGVLYGRPFGFREGLFIWPWTFFLYTWSAAAGGPCFTILITKITEKITRKKLVKDEAIEFLAKVSGWMILTYIIAKTVDTWYWATVTAPSKGLTLMDFYSNNPLYGIWILIAEIVVCGFVPAFILITAKGRKNNKALWTAIILAVAGVCLNRWVMVLQVFIILIAVSHRYLPVFPHEAELNPLEPSSAPDPEPESAAVEPPVEPGQRLTPAEA